MAGITALGTTYTLPNYTGILYQLTPADTPFLSAIGGLSGGGQTTSVEFEWEGFDLRTAAQPAVLEGQDAPTPQERVRAQIKNVAQIHQETVGVTYTKQGAFGQHAGVNNEANNPIRSELDWQTAQMLKQIARDIEWSFINGVYQLPSDNTTARKTRGLLAAIVTNVIDATGGTVSSAATATAASDLITLTAHGLVNGDTIRFTAVGAATPLVTTAPYFVVSSTANTFQLATVKGGTAVDITADGTGLTWKKGIALTKTSVDNLIQTVYDNGGLMEGDTATLLVGSAQKRAITTAYLTAASNIRRELVGNIGGVTVDRIDTDFGTLNVMLDRHMPADVAAVVSMEQCSPVFLEVPSKGHFFAETLAKTGAYDKVMLYGEVGLAYGNERAHGKITGLSA